MYIIRNIQNRIYEIRGERVMLDFDLAFLYDVQTKVLNQAVKRNIKRFPSDFMFRLTVDEWQTNWSQFVTSSKHGIKGLTQFTKDSLPQNVTSTKKHRPKTSLPYAFTEQGVAMLSGILNSDKAIIMNISIMRAFVEVRKTLLLQTDLKEQLKQIWENLGSHDAQLNQIYEALENLLDEKAEQHKWDDQERIGFITSQPARLREVLLSIQFVPVF